MQSVSWGTDQFVFYEGLSPFQKVAQMIKVSQKGVKSGGKLGVSQDGFAGEGCAESDMQNAFSRLFRQEAGAFCAFPAPLAENPCQSFGPHSQGSTGVFPCKLHRIPPGGASECHHDSFSVVIGPKRVLVPPGLCLGKNLFEL